MELFLDSYARAPKEIVLDLDATDVPLHGEQENGKSAGNPQVRTAVHQVREENHLLETWRYEEHLLWSAVGPNPVNAGTVRKRDETKKVLNGLSWLERRRPEAHTTLAHACELLGDFLQRKAIVRGSAYPLAPGHAIEFRARGLLDEGEAACRLDCLQAETAIGTRTDSTMPIAE